MSRFFKPRFGFQAKVLFPIVALLLVVAIITMGIVQKRSRQQFERETRLKLLTAEAVFRNSLEIRARNLRARYRIVVNDPRFMAIAQKGDAPTLSQHFSELMEDVLKDDAEFVLFSTPGNGQLLAGFPNDQSLSIADLHAASANGIHRALNGETDIDAVLANDRLFNAISIPVRVRDGIVGVLTVAVPIGEATTDELRSLTRSDIVLLADNKAVASTLNVTNVSALLPGLLKDRSRDDGQKVVIGGEHFLALAGSFKLDADDREVGYILFFSYEDSLKELQATQHTLWLVSLVGVLFSTAAVWILVGYVAFPLRQLRDNAEAVGRGDFSRRVDLSTGDEIGALAQAFNRMTENLLSSRNELEKTVETLNATQAQLVQREKLSAVGEFVAGVAHELNNPLTAVIGFAELLQSSGVDERQSASLGYITKSAQRCQKIVQSLLSFARQHQPERKPASLNELLESIIDLIGYDFQRGNIEIRREYAPDLGKIMVDPHQLQQVFANLLTNARHALEGTGRPGWVRIVTQRREGKIKVIFQDNGPGIPKEILPKIFDPFFTTKGVGKGTGLGLSLSYGIIKEHEGSISVVSQPGAGASFIIELPAIIDDSNVTPAVTETPPRPQREAVAAGPAPDRRILVVDDEDWILEFVKRALRADGWQVDAVLDGEAAFAAISRFKYDVILCDLRMPGLSGAQLHERVRRSHPDAAARFVFMTGDVVSESSRSFLDEEKRCLTKPFSMQDLRGILRDFVASSDPVCSSG